MKTVWIVGIVGAVAIGTYFVLNATSKPTDEAPSGCSGDWTDYINPACLLNEATSKVSNAVNTATNEINTILIILAVVVVLVVGLLAFGPQTGHLATAAGRLAL